MVFTGFTGYEEWFLEMKLRIAWELRAKLGFECISPNDGVESDYEN